MDIPLIAGIGKVRIGYSTQEDLALQWGEGLEVTGSHSNSGRVWRVPGTRSILHTDGFEYSARGLVVDGLTIDEADGIWAGAPYASLPEKEFRWLGEVQPGMRRSAVLEILRRRSLSMKRTGTDLVVRARGLYSLEDHKITRWSVVLGFRDDLVIRLSMAASE